jgi:hypothetical protein
MDSARHPDVALLFPSQHAEAATVLGRAFVDDPQKSRGWNSFTRAAPLAQSTGPFPSGNLAQ